ncbi:serine hydrolase [Costertonia aggregata]|uniref:Serine hydrolase n=2 Tax=Costertonia aggregata TaxID=343403 RepID=A0A7H9AUZ3_9FLAO|nr:serine hydrolase [Costertonia aggregata]
MKILKRFLLVLLLVLIATVAYNYPKLNLISGFASKNMASTVFIAERGAESVVQNENDMPLIRLADVSMGKAKAKASVFGLMQRETICREGLGCVLVNEEYDASKIPLKPKRTQLKNNLPFPYGNNGKKDTVFDNIEYDKLNDALDYAFSNYETQKTRTVLVVYKNEIVAERYLDGFDEETPILGWSMTKSILGTLYGILQYEGKIALDHKPFGDDIRMKNTKMGITLNHLLRMQSGLEWDEDYASISDVTKMLFMESDMTLAQAKKKVIAPPGEVWNYSSGTTNLLSGELRKQFDTHQKYLDFPYTALIDKIGMHSMLIETDMMGNFVGSSYAWANTRDWAKFGLLYLNRGNWNGERIFSPQWVDYVTKPTEHSDGVYGAHFWLNAGGKYPDVPKDLYSANGFQGQRVFIIPSKDLVVVRTGLANEDAFDSNVFLRKIVSAIK